MRTFRNRTGKVAAWAVLVAIIAPMFLLTGCGGGGSRASLPPIDDSRSGYNRPLDSGYNRQMGAPVAPTGMTTRQKLIALTGAAALYYLYKKHNSSPTVTSQSQYYMSRNGRVYYRDAQGQAHWVTPPPGGIQVPEREAAQYRDFQGYNNSATGRDLTNLQEARF